MASKIFPIRMSDDFKKKIEAQAEMRGISIAALIKERIATGIDFPPFVSTLLARFSMNLDLTVDKIIENILIDYFARSTAELTVFGAHRSLAEFSRDDKKNLMSGKELFGLLEAKYVKEFRNLKEKEEP